MFYLDNGIHPELSAPYSQSQNGLSERYMLKLGEAAQAMIAQAGCEQYDWPYAISYAAYLSNVTPTKGVNNDITPNEAYDGVHREYKVEGIFGCLCYAKVFVRRKAEPKARRCTFLGTSSVYKAFIVRDNTLFSESKKTFYSRDVRFDITVFPNQHVLVPRPVSFPVDDLVTTSSIVGDVDEFADATTSDISIDLDEDATNQQDELDEKHGSDGEDSCSLAELDLLAECSEGEDEEEPIVTTQSNNRRSARQRTLSSAAMERMVAEEMPEFTYEEEKQAIGNLFLLEDADPTTQGKAYESTCAHARVGECRDRRNDESCIHTSVY